MKKMRLKRSNKRKKLNNKRNNKIRKLKKSSKQFSYKYFHITI